MTVCNGCPDEGLRRSWIGRTACRCACHRLSHMQVEGGDPVEVGRVVREQHVLVAATIVDTFRSTLDLSSRSMRMRRVVSTSFRHLSSSHEHV